LFYLAVGFLSHGDPELDARAAPRTGFQDHFGIQRPSTSFQAGGTEAQQFNVQSVPMIVGMVAFTITERLPGAMERRRAGR
jgi:hypothetical protein